MRHEPAPANVAIEQTRVDARALGAVRYEMVTDDPRFTGATVQAIVAEVMSERRVPPSTARDPVPAHVEAAILTSLAKRPADRFASAREFSAALGQPSGDLTVSGARALSVHKMQHRGDPRWRQDQSWDCRMYSPIASSSLGTVLAVRCGHGAGRGATISPPCQRRDDCTHHRSPYGYRTVRTIFSRCRSRSPRIRCP